MTASNRPTTVHLSYHHDDGSWWAESDQIPSLFAGGDSLDDAKQLAQQAVVDKFGEDVVIAEWMPVPTALVSIVASPEEKTVSKGDQAQPATIEPWPEVPSQGIESDLQHT